VAHCQLPTMARVWMLGAALACYACGSAPVQAYMEGPMALIWGSAARHVSGCISNDTSDGRDAKVLCA